MSFVRQYKNLILLVLLISGCVETQYPASNNVSILTKKSTYVIGEKVVFLITNHLEKAIWYDQSCSIGPCYEVDETLQCNRLVGILCPQLKLDPGERISLEYARPVMHGEVQFSFFYLEDQALSGGEYKQVLSNRIELKTEKISMNKSKECSVDSDCRAVFDYCNCRSLCLGEHVVLKPCAKENSTCTFSYDTQVCYCINNECIEGPTE